MYLLVPLGLLALAGVAGTLRIVLKDGYRRVPTRW